ncbi:MAG: metal ABC transporter substrate-binding protein [Acetivibrionales bacterium]|jgi:zinc transport system substrate-binding protein|nr:zinc ABC transporter solute-binding protein [Clostridiaceae bacterium]
MKKIKILFIIMVLSVAFNSCANSHENINDSDYSETVIVTSFYPMYILTANIAKDIDGVSVVNMTEPQTGCLHDYQLSPSDIKILERADIFVINGAGMESFLDKVMSQLPDLKIIEASKGIELLENHEHENERDEQHAQDDHGHQDHDGHFHSSVNPHVWVSISGAIDEVKNIADSLIEIDPSNKDAYRKNSQEYIQRLENLKDEMHYELKDIKTRDIVTFHEAFPYFAREFDLNIVAVVKADPDSEASAGELAKTIKAIEELEAKVIFVEPQYSTKVAESIASQTGAKIYTLDPIVTGPKDAQLDSYEEIMRENLKVLTEALK